MASSGKNLYTAPAFGGRNVPHCDKLDSQSHLMHCDSYKYLREGRDLNSDKNLVDYFRDVISLRDKMENLT